MCFNFIKFLIINVTIFFSVCGSAEVTLVNIIEKNNTDIGMLTYIQLKNKQHFLVVPKVFAENDYAYEFYTMKDDKKPISNIKIPNPTLLSLQSYNETDLIISIDLDSTIRLYQINSSLKIKNTAVLKNFGSVTNAKQINNGYMISGFSSDIPGTNGASAPLSVKLNDQLVEVNRFMYVSPNTGEMRVLGQYGKNVIVIMNTSDGTSILGNLSSDFTLTDQIKLDGAGATGLISGDGIVVAYVDKENVLVMQRFDKDKKSLWKTNILKRSGVGAGQFNIIQHKKDFTLIGTNEKALTVIGITQNGSITNIFSDKSMLGGLIGRDYASMTDGVNIDIFGEVSRGKSTYKCSKAACEFRVHMRVNGDQLLSYKQ
jgi:hypothetical protein